MLGLISERQRTNISGVNRHSILLYQAANMGFIMLRMSSHRVALTHIHIRAHHILASSELIFSFWIFGFLEIPGVVVYSFWTTRMMACMRVTHFFLHRSRTHAIFIWIIYFGKKLLHSLQNARYRSLNSSSFRSVAECFDFSFEFSMFLMAFLFVLSLVFIHHQQHSCK